MSDDIETIPTLQLLEELFKRFDHAVFAATQIRDQITGETQMVRKWKNPDVIHAGLAGSLEHIILHLCDRGMRDTSGEWQ